MPAIYCMVYNRVAIIGLAGAKSRPREPERVCLHPVFSRDTREFEGLYVDNPDRYRMFPVLILVVSHGTRS
jgi:hypothetical protein